MSTSSALQRAAGNADRFVVVDTETTGLYNVDRVLEVAMVTISTSGDILDSYDTLVQPRREVSASHIHGITAAMLRDAPTFDEIAGDVAVRLHGACLVAFNLPFDLRMLTNEFRRIGADLEAADGIDLLRVARCRLKVACDRWGIPLAAAHSARGDALATAELLRKLADECEPGAATRAPGALMRTGRALPRGEQLPRGRSETPLITYLASRLQHDGVDAAALAYLECVGRAAADLHVTSDEKLELAEFAASLGLSEDQAQQCHRRYLNELTDDAVEDGIVTDEEYDMLLRIARGLDIDENLITERVNRYRFSQGHIDVRPGMSVVMTGEHPNLDRSQMAHAAGEMGLVVQPSVSRTTTFVAAADPTSSSGKAAKARQYGIPIVGLDDFAKASIGTRLTVAGGGVAGLRVFTCPDCLATWTEPSTAFGREGRRCADCGGVRSNQATETKQQTPGLGSGGATEALTCQTCGNTWHRTVSRGRKPRFCPTCEAGRL